MKTLDLIIPCYNEEAVLPLFYEAVRKTLAALPDCRATLLFVDDGSTDGTLQVLKAFAARNGAVRYLSFSRNFGKEAAMLAGLRASGGDLVAIMDADLQHSPALLLPMLQAIEEGYDVAAAKRTDRTGETRLKSRLSDAFYHAANKITQVEIDPGAQDFRLMTRPVVNAVLSAEAAVLCRGVPALRGGRLCGRAADRAAVRRRSVGRPRRAGRAAAARRSRSVRARRAGRLSGAGLLRSEKPAGLYHPRNQRAAATRPLNRKKDVKR